MLNMLALKITWGCDQWPDVPTHRAPLASGHADQGGDVETLSRLSGVIINIAMIGLPTTATHGIPGPGCGQARQRSCIKYSGSPPPHFQIVQDFCTNRSPSDNSPIWNIKKLLISFLLCLCFQRKNSLILHTILLWKTMNFSANCDIPSAKCGNVQCPRPVLCHMLVLTCDVSRPPGSHSGQFIQGPAGVTWYHGGDGGQEREKRQHSYSLYSLSWSHFRCNNMSSILVAITMLLDFDP